MSDLFTLKSIPLTSEIGMVFKNFRIENKVTAKSINTKFNKASSYISKLEKGDIKKIDSDFFIELCNFISENSNGLEEILNRLALKYTDFSNESKLTIMNIDDLLIEYAIPQEFISETVSYMKKHDISVQELVSEINANKDICKREYYSLLPENIWYSYEDNIDAAIIKLCIPQSYIEDLLYNEKYKYIHRVIAEAILYSLFRLGNEKNARMEAFNRLELYHMVPKRSSISVNEENIEELLGGLEPDSAEAFKDVCAGLKVITVLSKEYGSKRIKQISKNMHEDLGFCFAYMALDLIDLEKQSHERKKEFLSELKSLIEKYSKKEETKLDLYI